MQTVGADSQTAAADCSGGKIMEVRITGGSVSQTECAAAAAVIRFLTTSSVEQCAEVVTPDVRSLCEEAVSSGELPKAPAEVFDITCVDTDCKRVGLGFVSVANTPEGTKQWTVRKVDDRWRVTVSDGFGD